MNFKAVASSERKYLVLLLEPKFPRSFCAHDEETDDVGPIRDEDQGGWSTRVSVLGMDSFSWCGSRGRVQFFRAFHRPQWCLFVSLQFVWRLISL